MKDFHPSSLNTIRIVTVYTSHGIEILGSFIRFGTGGNIVDNGGKDGILAMVNPETGVVMTDGYNKIGKIFIKHPDTHKEIKGFGIPRYREMIELCKQAASEDSRIKIIGWDITLRENDSIEIIEGNHRPDAYGLQMPIKKGYKTRLFEMLKDQL